MRHDRQDVIQKREKLLKEYDVAATFPVVTEVIARAEASLDTFTESVTRVRREEDRCRLESAVYERVMRAYELLYRVMELKVDSAPKEVVAAFNPFGEYAHQICALAESQYEHFLKAGQQLLTITREARPVHPGRDLELDRLQRLAEATGIPRHREEVELLRQSTKVTEEAKRALRDYQRIADRVFGALFTQKVLMEWFRLLSPLNEDPLDKYRATRRRFLLVVGLLEAIPGAGGITLELAELWHMIPGGMGDAFSQGAENLAAIFRPLVDAVSGAEKVACAQEAGLLLALGILPDINAELGILEAATLELQADDTLQQNAESLDV